MWGYSLGALTATSLAPRHPAKVRRLVLASSHLRPDGYHPEITAPEQDDPRLPTEDEFAAWQADYEAVAPNPADFFAFLERLQPVVHDFAGCSAGEIRSITAPTFLVIGDRDFVRLGHAAEMLDRRTRWGSGPNPAVTVSNSRRARTRAYELSASQGRSMASQADGIGAGRPLVPRMGFELADHYSTKEVMAAYTAMVGAIAGLGTRNAAQ